MQMISKNLTLLLSLLLLLKKICVKSDETVISTTFDYIITLWNCFC